VNKRECCEKSLIICRHLCRTSTLVRNILFICRSVVRAEKHSVIQTPGYEKTPGELLVKSPFLFNSYYGNPKATSESFVDG